MSGPKGGPHEEVVRPWGGRIDDAGHRVPVRRLRRQWRVFKLGQRAELYLYPDRRRAAGGQ